MKKLYITELPHTFAGSSALFIGRTNRDSRVELIVLRKIMPLYLSLPHQLEAICLRMVTVLSEKSLLMSSLLRRL